MKDILCGAWFDESGQDVAEYALLLAAILAVVISVLAAVGNGANAVFNVAKAALGG